MADRPILFSGPMVRAILAGRKTQTRMVVKRDRFFDNGWPIYKDGRKVGVAFKSAPTLDQTPLRPGDRFWVREKWARVPATAYRMSTGVAQTIDPSNPDRAAVYAAGWERSKPGNWRPSIHMPRWASRITLTVTDVRCERLRDTSEADAKAEGITVGTVTGRPLYHAGIPPMDCNWSDDPQDAFGDLWDSINAKRGYGWDTNPWVWVIGFTAEQRNIDEAHHE